ncbi:MAG TPA: nickel pincer cofactor biosynthesis protein LarC [Chloroflexota bacterium]|nr:nickel pincer cofactor biosynthesis protein LarC [Chloroflexota bacterium]
MTRAAYFECFSGASGDMILGALIDAGWPEAEFRAALQQVPLEGWEAQVREVKKGALRATQVRLRATTPQPERTLLDVAAIVEASTLPGAVKARTMALFRELAEVEGLEHRQPAETVHFHEVGAVDSILDIVGACAGLHAMGVERLFVSPLNVGGGIVPTRDGILPVPGPATLELLKRKGAPIYASEYGPEFLTPTGALILTSLADGFGPFPPMRVEAIGYGAGQRDFTIPNVVRLSIGQLTSPASLRSESRVPSLESRVAHEHGHHHGQSDGDGPYQDHQDHQDARPDVHQHPHHDGHTDVVVQLETNVDDMNPEWYGHLTERLLSGGALDVTLIPVLMKKGRPGTLISVLVSPDGVEAALGTLFAETTTLGIRIQEITRRVLDRQVTRVATPYGEVRVKVGLLNGRVRNVAPEYEDCRAAAQRAGVALRLVYEAATASLRSEFPVPSS